MPKAELTKAERNVMACFWLQELDFECGPTLMWRLENEVTHAEFLDMMYVMGKELEAEGTNQVEPPTEPIEIPWSDGGEFRQRLRQLMDGHSTLSAEAVRCEKDEEDLDEW